MARARLLLRADERYELVRLFSNYTSQRLIEMVNGEESIIPEKLYDYLPYIESQIQVALFKALDEYNKGTERSKRKRPQYFKRYVDEVSKNHITKTVMNMNAAISRHEGRASVRPSKSDKQLYETLQLTAEGHDLLELKLEELEK